MNYSKGFTIIEIVMALFLLTVGTVGAFSLIQKTITFSSITSSQLVATYLAQEAIEIIRNIRDTNYLEGSLWTDGIGFVTDYRLGYQSTSFPDATCGNYLKNTGSFYVCSSDATSKFQRQIIIAQPEADKITISVTVSWQERGNSHQVFAQTLLDNWR
ncbi:MAG: prepilin-type N-terminal cleavage/methylation domain-containing protein [Patescibacteria group bacterium]